VACGGEVQSLELEQLRAELEAATAAQEAGGESLGESLAVSHSCACIGWPCPRQCVHGAPIGGVRRRRRRWRRGCRCGAATRAAGRGDRDQTGQVSGLAGQLTKTPRAQLTKTPRAQLTTAGRRPPPRGRYDELRADKDALDAELIQKHQELVDAQAAAAAGSAENETLSKELAALKHENEQLQETADALVAKKQQNKKLKGFLTEAKNVSRTLVGAAPSSIPTGIL
jgi:hypothetical protein